MSDIRIVSDGTIHGTHVYDRDGRELTSVTRVEWEIDVASGVARAQIDLIAVELDVAAEEKHVDHIARILIPRREED